MLSPLEVFAGGAVTAGWPGSLGGFLSIFSVLPGTALPGGVAAWVAVGGAEVMRVLGLPPGPAVGEALESLLQHVIEHPEDNRPEALRARLEALREARNDAAR